MSSENNNFNIVSESQKQQTSTLGSQENLVEIAKKQVLNLTIDIFSQLRSKTNIPLPEISPTDKWSSSVDSGIITINFMDFVQTSKDTPVDLNYCKYLLLTEIFSHYILSTAENEGLRTSMRDFIENGHFSEGEEDKVDIQARAHFHATFIKIAGTLQMLEVFKEFKNAPKEYSHTLHSTSKNSIKKPRHLQFLDATLYIYLTPSEHYSPEELNEYLKNDDVKNTLEYLIGKNEMGINFLDASVSPYFQLEQNDLNTMFDTVRLVVYPKWKKLYEEDCKDC